MDSQNYGLGNTPSTFQSTMTKTGVDYVYGENTESCNFGDYSSDFPIWIAEILTWGNTSVFVRGDNGASFNNTSVVVEYEPLVRITELSNISSSFNMALWEQMPWSIYYLPTNADNVDSQIHVSIVDENVAEINEQRKISDWQYYLYISSVADWQTEVVFELNWAEYARRPLIVTTVHANSFAGVNVNSVTVPNGWRKEVNLIGLDPAWITNMWDDFTLTMDDTNVANFQSLDDHTWIFRIVWNNIWTTQAHVYLNSDPSTVYDIDITVTDAIAYYPLEINNDESQGAYPLLYNNGVGYTTYWNANASEFNGQYSFFYTDNFLGSRIEWDSDFSFSIWVAPLSWNESYVGIVWTWESGNKSNALLYYHNNTLWIGWYDNDRDTWTSLPLNDWSHLVFTHSNGTAKVYVNGSLVLTDTVDYDITPWHFTVWTDLTTNGQFFYGYMNNLTVAQKEFTAQEVADMYNAWQSSHVVTTA